MAAYTQTQYNSLIAAISTGSKKVEYGDKKVTYNNLAEMLELKRLMEKDLGLGDYAEPIKIRRTFTYYNSGI